MVRKGCGGNESDESDEERNPEGEVEEREGEGSGPSETGTYTVEDKEEAGNQVRALRDVCCCSCNGNPIRLLAIGYWHFCPEIKGTAALILNFLRSGKLFDIPSSTISHLRDSNGLTGI